MQVLRLNPVCQFDYGSRYACSRPERICADSETQVYSDLQFGPERTGTRQTTV